MTTLRATSEQLREIAARLEKENVRTNDGRGSSVCRSVISELVRGDWAGATLVADLDFDKVTQYPELAALFVKLGLVKSSLHG